nr:hypothetical protein [Tanacetum cinerariifolium]
VQFRDLEFDPNTRLLIYRPQTNRKGLVPLEIGYGLISDAGILAGQSVFDQVSAIPGSHVKHVISAVNVVCKRLGLENALRN